MFLFIFSLAAGTIIVPSYCQDDRLFILLDTINSYECDGVFNEISVQRKHINIVDGKGCKVQYIEAPGEYFLEFEQIDVDSPLPNLSGDIGAMLQVPVFDGPIGLRFDVPYQIIPDQSSGRCDDSSGAVNVGDKQYCRYCNLCDTTDDTVAELSRRKFDRTDSQTNNDFSDVCRRVDAKTYRMKKRIELPGKNELERQARERFGDLDANAKRKLEEGRGRFQVFLNLISSDTSAASPDLFYGANRQCQCCAASARRDPVCQRQNAFNRCSAGCSSGYARQCLQGNARIVGCLTVEFNYQVTQDYNVVRDFLSTRGLPEQACENAVRRPPPLPTSEAAVGEQRSENEVKTACVNAISASNRPVKNYCRTFWQRQLCCQHCANVC